MSKNLDEKSRMSVVNSKKIKAQLQTKMEAEDILDEAHRQTESIYRQVQGELIEIKQKIKEFKQISDMKNQDIIQQWDKNYSLLEVTYAIKQQSLKKTYEQAGKEMEALLSEKSIEYKIELDIKKEQYQKEWIRYLDYLRKENQWFISYQEQAMSNLESKEKQLYLTMQKKQEKYKLNEQALKNQLNYYKDSKYMKEKRIVKIGIGVLLLAAVRIIQLTISRPQLIIEKLFPILIACAAVYLLSLNMSKGKKEKKYNQLFHHNQLLIDQNEKLKKEAMYREEDLRKLMDKKILSEKLDRSFSDNFQFLKIMQQDLKDSELKRKVLESENTALRKYLLLKKNNED
ncbi:MAG: hypothetical protein WBA84_01960 [Carnobacterium sp.]|uniref:hypothetical protein n=1 Tax=Carnobacterium sp. TaxID=48221 RepID=UPI003C75FFB5